MTQRKTVLDSLPETAPIFEYLNQESINHFGDKTKIYDKDRKDWEGRRKRKTEREQDADVSMSLVKSKKARQAIKNAVNPAEKLLEVINGKGSLRTRTPGGVKLLAPSRPSGFIWFHCVGCSEPYLRFKDHIKSCRFPPDDWDKEYDYNAGMDVLKEIPETRYVDPDE